MEQTTKKSKSGLGWLTWVIIWVAGMAGQLAWNIENQWFNTYVYAKIAPDSNIITWMVATSAVVSTIATFLGGTLSDRVGKRRIFVLVGYVMWGVSTIVFGCTQFFGALILESVMVVVFDCVMSFFGSIGNDCGFNPWTTDISTPANRGSLGTAIAIQPVIATIIGSIAFGAIIDGFAGLKTPNGQSLDYFMMFLIVGSAIALIGVFSFFFMKESPTLFPHREVSFGKALAKPFNFKLIKENKLLFWVLMIFMAFFISFNVYFPHILNYFIYSCSSVTWLNESLNLGINTTAGAIMAVGLLLGVPLVIVSGKFLNKQKFIPVLIISVLANILGLAVLFIDGVTGAEKSLQIVLLFLGTFLLGAGYMGLYQALMVWVKDLYPSDMRSQFEGVRMIFYICIPMFLGTLVGNFIIK
jgi:MFS family permease